jgi:hypothetical protein
MDSTFLAFSSLSTILSLASLIVSAALRRFSVAAVLAVINKASELIN